MALRPALLLALTLTALFAGCTGPAGPATDSTGPRDVTVQDQGADGDGSHGRSSVTSTKELGSAEGTSAMPARYPFTVSVPAEGAKNVHWELRVETSSNSLLQRIEGPGCGSTGLIVSVVGTNTFGGKCDDLAAGEHDFTVVLDAPALSFSAVVDGQVTVVTEW